MKTTLLGIGAVAVWLGWLGCHQAPKRTSGDEAPLAATSKAAASKAPAPAGTARKPAELNPSIIAKAEEILRANPGADFGTEFPFEQNGRKYVARVEEHDNPEGDPRRPDGEHKGITVYSAD
jgi:hypothetical protein